MPSAEAQVATYALDAFEVTVGRFRAFLEDFGAWRAGGHPALGEGAHPRVEGTGWGEGWPLAASAAQLLVQRGTCSTSTWTDEAGPNEAKPINCLSWYEAFAFCVWDGGRLPTEAEWERAASGGEERLFPWSSPPGSAVIGHDHAAYGCVDALGGPECIHASGSFPLGNGRWGHADLAGNVFEWVLDWYAPGHATCNDCSNTDSATGQRTIRGGGYYVGEAGVRATSRLRYWPTERWGFLGLRCARDGS